MLKPLDFLEYMIPQTKSRCGYIQAITRYMLNLKFIIPYHKNTYDTTCEFLLNKYLNAFYTWTLLDKLKNDPRAKCFNFHKKLRIFVGTWM